ncbi:hypothetical protein [Dapis sp. BLCC M126]|uniref:hypothetical protein n=1 Tax=Dapis sp. BLCC M126 TaxID=3400189 RepID=UPI003CF90891
MLEQYYEALIITVQSDMILWVGGVNKPLLPTDYTFWPCGIDFSTQRIAIA